MATVVVIIVVRLLGEKRAIAEMTVREEEFIEEKCGNGNNEGI